MICLVVLLRRIKKVRGRRHEWLVPTSPHFMTITVLHRIAVFTRPETVARRLGGAQAIPNIQYEVLAKLDAPSAHLLGIASAPPNLR